ALTFSAAASVAHAQAATTTQTTTTSTDLTTGETVTTQTGDTDRVVIDPPSGRTEATVIPPARGDDQLYAREHSYKQGPASDAGIGFLLGGGLTNFTASSVREATELGGAWDARLIFGTRRVLGLEAAYVGSVNDINAFGLSGDTKLIGTGVQGLARVNLTTTDFQPYLLGGAGWKHYALAGERFNVSNIRNDDNVVEIPMGLGFAYHNRGFMFDVRGLYNYALNSNLFTNGTPGVDGPGDLHNWGARASLGFEL
ncbi:MAG TPA: hypothetical protein VLC93_09020, partial [Myxococcota bacterium]|nr:hypothetical protein [Myxococcota bacterium]